MRRPINGCASCTVASEVVRHGVENVESGDHPGDPPAGLVHGKEFERGLAEGPAALVDAVECDLRHRVLQHPGTHRMPFIVVRVEETFR